ncbi:SipW-dependent-type signal peptide-containing protein [Microbacterium profundi]
MSVRAVSVRRRRKVMAIVAGGMALGVAGMVTLAAWNDNEWVFGGTGPNAGDGEGVGTSQFNVQQNAWKIGDDVPTTASAFTDHEDNPGDALIFNVDPTGLTPGDTIFAPVALKTDGTSVAGKLQLTAAEAADSKIAHDDADAVAGIADDALWDALRYSVRVTADPLLAANCTLASFASAGSPVVTNLGLSDTVPTATQDLLAGGGNVQYYCFAITLPGSTETENQDLQGRVVFPAWRFAATSS